MLAPIGLLAQRNHQSAWQAGKNPSSQKAVEDPVNENLERMLSKSTEYKGLLAEIEVAKKTLDKQTKACVAPTSQSRVAPNLACLQSLHQAQSHLDSLQKINAHFRVDANRMLELFEANPKTNERMASAAKAFAAGKIQTANAILDAARIIQIGDSALRMPMTDVRHRLSNQAANELTFKAFLQSLDFHNPQRCQNVANYANQALKYAETKDNLLDIGILLLYEGQYDLGAPFLAKALRFDIGVHREAFLAAELADHYMLTGDSIATEAMFQRAAAAYLKLAEDDKEAYGIELSDVLLKYAGILAIDKRYEEASELYIEARMCVEGLSNFNPRKGGRLINICWQMGWMYEQNPKGGSPLDMYAKAVEISDHLKMDASDNKAYYQFKTLKRFAEACARLQQPQKAAECYERAFPIAEQFAKADPATYGPDLVAMIVDWIGVNETLGDTKEVERLHMLVINIGDQLWPSSDADLKKQWAMNQMNLGDFYLDQSRFSDGVKCYQTGWPLFRQFAAQAPEAYAPEMARTTLNYALLLREMGRYPASDSLFRESIAIYEKLVTKAPELHQPLLGFSLGHHGLQLLYEGKLVEAEQRFRRSLEIHQEIDQRQPGSDYEHILWNYICISNCLGRQDKHAEAEVWYATALEFAEAREKKEPGTHSLEIASVLADLADCKADQGNFAEACVIAQRCLQVRMDSDSTNPETRDYSIAAAHNGLGYFQTLNGQFDEAGTQLTIALASFQKLVLSGKSSAYNEFLRSFNNIQELKDSLEAHKSWHKATAIQSLRARLTEGLAGDLAGLDSVRATAYGALSWALLFEQKYAEAQAAAEKGLDFDPTQNWIRTNLGHAYLFRGDWENATKIYQIYLDYNPDKQVVGDALVEDWNRMEQENLVPEMMLPEIEKARAWLKERIGAK